MSETACGDMLHLNTYSALMMGFTNTTQGYGCRICGAPYLRSAHVQARAGADPLGRHFARMALAGLPRGGGDGDAIRMGILNVMRDNGIREGHRPVRALLQDTPPDQARERQSALLTPAVRVHPTLLRIYTDPYIGKECRRHPHGHPQRDAQ